MDEKGRGDTVSEPRIDWVSRYELLATLQLGDRMIGHFPNGLPPGWTWLEGQDSCATCIYTGQHLALYPEPTMLFRVHPAASPTAWTAGETP
jgi:hypothetical protein